MPRIPAAANYGKLRQTPTSSGAGQAGPRGQQPPARGTPTPRNRRGEEAQAKQAEQAKSPQVATSTWEARNNSSSPNPPSRWTGDVVGGSTGCTETSQNGESRPLPPRRAVGRGGPHGPPNQRTGVLWTSSGGFQRTLQFSGTGQAPKIERTEKRTV